MSYSKSSIAILTKDAIGLHDSSNDGKKFDPDKTIYNLKTRSIKSGTAVIFVRGCKNSLSSLIMIDNDLFWIQTSSLELRD